MKTYKTKTEAQQAKQDIINVRDWEDDMITVGSPEFSQAVHNIKGWILLDSWNKPLEH